MARSSPRSTLAHTRTSRRRSVTARRAVMVVVLLIGSACNAISGLDRLTVGEGAEDASADGAPIARPDASNYLDAEVDAADSAPPLVCPSKGGKMVNFGSFCIDATEVTVEAYNQFIAATDKPAQEGPCAWNDDFGRTSNAAGELPMVRVDWCDARAFCQWAGKRLCGRLTPDDAGSLALDPAVGNDPQVSEHGAACSAFGAQGWPYGDTFVEGNCNTGRGSGEVNVEPPTDRARCAGSQPELYALVGNVWEWIDACDGGAGSTDFCRFAGGSVQSDASVRCGVASGWTREYRAYDVGIRCCY